MLPLFHLTNVNVKFGPHFGQNRAEGRTNTFWVRAFEAAGAFLLGSIVTSMVMMTDEDARGERDWKQTRL